MYMYTYITFKVIRSLFRVCGSINSLLPTNPAATTARGGCNVAITCEGDEIRKGE